MQKNINPEVEIGDRIILVYMRGESEIVAGDKGVVTGFEFLPRNELKINIDWDNGSKLPLLSNEDLWIKSKPKRITEQPLEDMLLRNVDAFNYFNLNFLLKYLKKVAKSGVVNMYESPPFLYMGKKSINRYYGENREDDELFIEVLNLADEAKDKMIMGTMKYMGEKNLDLDDISQIERNVKKFAIKIFEIYRNFTPN